MRTTLEIFSKDWEDFVVRGEISADEVRGAEELVYGKKPVVQGGSSSSSSSAASSSPPAVSTNKASKKELKKSSLESLLAPDDLPMVPVDEKQSKKVLSDFALRHLGITPTEEQKHNPLKRFWELRRAQVEPVSDWRNRVLLWDWVKACLRGSGSQPGQWFSWNLGFLVCVIERRKSR